MKKLLLLFFLSISFSAFSDSDKDLDFTLSDFCFKQPSVQDRGGVLYLPNQQVGITAKSTCVYKDEYGQFYSQGRLKNGVRNGKWIFWHKNGAVFQEQNWVNGLKQGMFNHWYENEEKQQNHFYQDDALKEITRWNKKGEIELSGSEDSKTGNLKITVYKSGVITAIGIAKHTPEKLIEHGKWTLYFPDSGLRHQEGNYKNGERVGSWIEWNKTGQNIIKTLTYEDGKCTNGDCN
jgi:antitoxin component YwqK of YwqJK toxin-antitoxin module